MYKTLQAQTLLANVKLSLASKRKGNIFKQKNFKQPIFIREMMKRLKVLWNVWWLLTAVLFLATCNDPAPRIGHWQGEYLSFTLTEENKLQNLQLEGEEVFNQNCLFNFNEDMPLTNERFEYLVSNENGNQISLILTFETETTASLSYSYSLCPFPASVSSGVQEGIRTAIWQKP